MRQQDTQKVYESTNDKSVIKNQIQGGNKGIIKKVVISKVKFNEK